MGRYAILGERSPEGGTLVSFADDLALDAAHRLRVGLPQILFDQTFAYRTGATFWDQAIVGGGSSITHDPNAGQVILTAGTGASDSVIRQTFEYFHYRPGRSHLAVMTFTLGAAAADVRRRVGYFDAENGIFLEQNGTTDVAIVRRSKVSGSVVEERVVQASWNNDRLDGIGTDGNPSKISLDLSKGQRMLIDLVWHGYGGVRIAFDIGGEWRWAHRFLATNNLTVPYMTTGSLPLRFEITNLAAQGVSHTFRQGCSTVQTEDGTHEQPALSFAVDTGITTHAVTTQRALISLRPKATVGGVVNRATLLVSSINLLVGTNNCHWELVFNPTFSGTPVWLDPGTLTNAEYSIHTDAAAGAFTGGTHIIAGYGAVGAGIVAQQVAVDTLHNRLKPFLDMNGANPQAISLVATAMAGISSIAAAMNYLEVR